MPSYPLDFPINAGSPSPLNNIAKAAQEIAAKTKLSSSEMGLFTGFLKQAETSGLSYNRSINETIRQFGKMGGSARAFALELKDVVDAENRAAAATERAAERKIRAIEREAAAISRAAQSRRAKELEAAKFENSTVARIGRTVVSRELGFGLAGASGIPRAGFGLSSGIGSALSGLGGAALVGSGIVAGVAAITAAALAAAKAAGEIAKEQTNAAQRTSLSVKEYSLLAAAAKVAGVEEGSLTTAQRTLSKALSDNSAEGKVAKEALQQLGITATNAMGGFVGARNFLEDFDRGLQRISGPEKEDVIIKVFGRGGLELLPLFNGHLKETIDGLDKAGAGFDNLSAKSARNFESALDRMTVRWKAFVRDIGVGVAESIGFEDPAKERAENLLRQRQGLLSSTQGGKYYNPDTGKFDLAQPAANTILPSDLARIKNRGAPGFSKDPVAGRFDENDLHSQELQAFRLRMQRIGETFDSSSKEGRVAGIENEIRELENKRTQLLAQPKPTLGPDEKDYAPAAARAEKQLSAIQAQLIAKKQLLDVERKSEETEKRIQSYLDGIAKKTATIPVPLLGPSGVPLLDPNTGLPRSIDVPSPVMDIYAHRDAFVKETGASKAQAARLTGGANIEAAAEIEKAQDEATKQHMERELFTRNKFEKESPENAIRATGIIAGMPEENALRLTPKDVDEGLKRNAELLARNAKDANSMQAAIRTIQEESAKHQAETNTRLQASLATSGMTGAQKITTEGAFDIQGAARSRDEQIAALGPAVDKLKPLVEYTADEFKRMEASAKIVADFKKQEGEIAARTLIQLDQERQRTAEQHASTFAAGIMAAATHSGEAFGRGLGRSIGEKMLENFGKNFIFQKNGPFDKMQGTVDPNSFLGKITHETGLFREESPLNAPALKFDSATERFSAAVDRHNGATPAPASTTGQFGAGVPGYSNFGSGTNGKYGAAGGAASIFKSIESFLHRKPIPPAVQGGVAPSGTALWTRPLTEHITTLLGGSGGEGLSGRGGFEGIASGRSGPSNSAIEAEARELSLNTSASRDLTSAIEAQTKATEYVSSGGAAGEMPGGAAPPVVTGPAGINGLTGGGASGGLGAIGAAIPLLGAVASGVTALAKLTGIGVPRGQHAGEAGGGGSSGNGASVIFQQSAKQTASIAKDVSELTKNLAAPPLVPPSSTPSFGSGTNGIIGSDGLPIGQANSRLTSDLAAIYSAPGGVRATGLASFMGTMSNVGRGFGAVAGGGGLKAFGQAVSGSPDISTGPGSATAATPGARVGVIAGTAAAGLGVFEGVNTASKGGAKNVTSGIADTAMAIAPFTGPAAPFVMAGAMALKMVSSFLGDPKVQRQKEISKKLFQDQYQAPEALNVTSSTRGTFADIGRDGNIRQSSLSPYPRVTTPYLDLPYRFNVPGTQSSQYGGGGTIQVTMHNNISAMDAGSFESFLKKNPNALMEGFSHGLTFGASRAAQSIKGVIGMG